MKVDREKAGEVQGMINESSYVNSQKRRKGEDSRENRSSKVVCQENPSSKPRALYIAVPTGSSSMW